MSTPHTEDSPPESSEPQAARRAAEDPAPRRPISRARLLIVIAAGLAVLLALAIPAATVLLPWWNDANATPSRSRIAAGKAHTCAIVKDGSVKCWGDNASGQLGNASTISAGVPVAVVGLTGVVSLAAGGDHTCALTAAGAVLCWGANGTGQVGDGSTETRATPVAVEGLTSGVLAVATSESHSCALLGDRSVKCWGDNGSGQLGTGDNRPSSTPVAVKDLPPRSTAVVAGSGFTCVVFTGRTVRCWGDNSDGQLGLGDLTQRFRWEPVIGLPRTGFVAAGDSHACVVTADGVIMCWGSNGAGQLGTTLAAQSAAAPMAVPGLSGRYASVAAGYDRTCAVTVSGGVTCWGGQATDPAIDSSIARPVASLTGVRQVTAGAFHACAATDDQVFCWGRNDQGQLGSASGVIGVDPVAVEGL